MQRLLQRGRRRLVRLSAGWPGSVAVQVMLLTITACSFEPPQAPSWDATFSIPLISRHYTMEELIDKESSLSTDSLGQVHFLFDTELDSFGVGDQLTLKEFSDYYSTLVGAMPVASPGGANLDIAVVELYPPAAGADEETVIVPAFDFDLGKRGLQAYDGFDWLEVVSGTVTLQVKNDLAVPVGSPLHLGLYDTRSDTLIASVDYIGEVAPGSELRQVIDLAGKKFSNELSLEISGNSPGSREQPVLLSSASAMAINATISDLQVKSAHARISSQEITDRREALVDESVVVNSANIKQGMILLELSSHLPVAGTVSITLPDFISPSGDMCRETIALNPAATASRTLDLAGYRFEPETAPPGQQTMLVAWSVQTPGTGAEYVTVQSSDAVNIRCAVADMVFSEVTGSFDGKTVTIDPATYTVDIPDGVDSVHFENVQLELRLRNGINFPARTNLLLEGFNNSAQRVEMRIQETILAGQSNGQAVESQIVLNRNNSNVSEFLDALPSSIRLSGTVTIGEAGYVGTVRESDAVTGTVRIEAPLSFSLPAQHVEVEADSLEIGADVREKIRDDLREGKLTARILNHLPLGASLSFYLGRNPQTVYAAPLVVIGPLAVQPATIDRDTGLVQEALLSEVTVGLTEEQLQVFDSAPLFSGLLIDFPGSNGQLVRIIRTDYIDIKAVATITSAIDPHSNP